VEDVGGCFFSWVFLCLFGLCLLMGGVTAYDDWVAQRAASA